jgi:hypothetical protein
VNKHTLFFMYLCTFLPIFFQLNMLIYGVSIRCSDLRYLLDENCGALKIEVDYVTGALKSTPIKPLLKETNMTPVIPLLDNK